MCYIFNYTNRTPIRSLEIVRRLGLVGNKEYSRKILNGMWVPPTNFDKYPKDIILNMKKKSTINFLGHIEINITRESFRSHWRKAMENTASSI